ncbi:hypothetical protein BCR32DRAFT_292108, partial [Anaeromyces robustus]
MKFNNFKFVILLIVILLINNVYSKVREPKKGGTIIEEGDPNVFNTNKGLPMTAPNNETSIDEPIQKTNETATEKIVNVYTLTRTTTKIVKTSMTAAATKTSTSIPTTSGINHRVTIVERNDIGGASFYRYICSVHMGDKHLGLYIKNSWF